MLGDRLFSLVGPESPIRIASACESKVEDFDTLTSLYKKIYHFLLLRCTSPRGEAKPPKDMAVEREVAAALESVFPRVGLRSFVALTGAEKAAQLQELTGIVLGIRLFNMHQKKGGAGLPPVDAKPENDQLLQQLTKESEEVSELCQDFADLLVTYSMRSKTESIDEKEVQRWQCDLLYHRQYLCYLLNLQEDVAQSLEKLRKGQAQLKEELMDLDALVGGRVSVPKEQVYPRFDALARCYRSAWREVQLLEARTKLHSVLKELRQRYFPAITQSGKALLSKSGRREGEPLLDENREDPVDLDSIPGPEAQDPSTAVRLTVENYEGFLNLALDFQGFCVQTLVSRKGLLVPGNPALGVVRYAGRYCVFATERAMAEFCSEPDRFFAGVREACYKQPELIHLLRVHEDFPRSSLQAILEMMAGQQSVMLADVASETPLHFQDSYIDKSYEWNEWRLRQDALHVADIRRKTTSTTQTALSHLRRENETQVYLPKEAATNTTASRGTNPPRLKKYFTGLRGEPRPMQVAECRYDL
ncbi:unnamed protein product [Effrenium voratum]|uniref:Cilia- and flagella-associated protein 206 n=1 Tax=Effrenium voratum TaxID=2562239 RepID=A0AA36J4I1_9DINO|nr:unnamed protein product [Effrenium voratum]